MRRLSDILVAVSAMVFIISLSVMLTLQFRPFYYLEIERLNIAEESGYSQEEIRENYDALIEYNVSPFQKELTLPSMPMSEEGRIHFREVKAIFQLILKLFIGSAVILSIGAVYKNQKKQYDYLKWAGIVTLVLPAALGILIFMDWENVFVSFHKMVFNNDYWLFDPATDPVIKILPDAYFMHCATLIIVLIFLGAMGCFALWKKKLTEA